MSGLSLRAINKSYGATPILRDVSLEVEEGEFLTLLGPSGCGKSTLLRIIAGLEAQNSGSVAIRGVRVDEVPPKDRDVAMVFQNYALYPHMTVEENLSLPLRMRRLNPWQRLPGLGGLMPGASRLRAEIKSEVLQAARSLDIEPLLHRKPGQLSGGQRQRTAIGRAIVRHPAVFLMDEPLSNLDAKLRLQMRDEISALHRRLGVTIIYVTHDQVEAMTMSDRVAVVVAGEIVQLGTPRALYSDPVDRRVAELVGAPSMRFLSAVIEDRTSVRVGACRLPLALDGVAGQAVSLGVRPQGVGMAAAAGASTLQARVVAVQDLGADVYLHLLTEATSEKLTVRNPPTVPALGALVHLALDPEQVFAFDPDGRRLRRSGAPGAAARRQA